MFESPAADTVAFIASGSAATLLLRYVWDSIVRRKTHLEDVTEARIEATLKEMQAALTAVAMQLADVRADVRSLLARTANHEERINGISGNHGSKLDNHSERLAALEADVTTLKLLLRPRGRDETPSLP